MKFYCRCDDHIKQYDGPSPEFYMTFWRITINVYTVTPSIDQTLHNPYYWSWPNYRIGLKRGLHRTFATGAAWQQTDTWSCPTLGLASVLMMSPISPEVCLFPYFWFSNIPRHFFLLNYKFLHYLLPNRYLASKWNRDIVKLSFSCNDEIENDEHLICDWRNIQQVRKLVSTWL